MSNLFSLYGNKSEEQLEAATQEGEEIIHRFAVEIKRWQLKNIKLGAADTEVRDHCASMLCRKLLELPVEDEGS